MHLDAVAPEALLEQRAHAPRRLAGHENQHAVTGIDERPHAVPEVVDGEFQIVLGEPEALDRSGAPGRRHRHHPGDVVQAHAHEFGPPLAEHVPLEQGQGGDAGQVGERVLGYPSVELAVERAPLLGPRHHFPQPLRLPALDGLAGETLHAQAARRPVVQGADRDGIGGAAAGDIAAGDAAAGDAGHRG